eukprot:TRINITY_DN74363_c0_g1_i1.p1 TRINITY_DN74363_c0_g1~~TRINITY_DN74363_c0_g1_i1.p1  ORF type:complete len:1440 (+),score=129.66 TRINITY_DN74363_c0_g1_i1:64-4383(+)
MRLPSLGWLLFILLCQHVCAKFNKWYAVDTQSVVCPVPPKPEVYPVGLTEADWPTAQEYAMTIDYTENMEPDQPHIVTILRPQGSREVTVEFQVVDANGDEVMSNTLVTLPATTGAASAGSCACTGVNTGVNVSLFGEEYGTSCETWDNDACDFLYPTLDMGPFCCKPWCYVDPNTCEDAWVSIIAPGLHFSYSGACSASPEASPCAWKAPAPCDCINVDTAPQWSSANITSFGAGYGSTCKTWDYTWCSELYPLDVIDYWCCASWCWVGSTCPSGIASQVWPGLFWSDAECPDDSKFVNQCPYKTSEAIDIVELEGDPNATIDVACQCLTMSPSLLQSGRRRAGQAFPTNYGEYCAAWDANYCKEYFPHENADIWCCQTWCYVDKECPSANPSLILPGWYWTYETCKEDGQVLANCAYSDACKPTGTNAGLDSADLARFGANYGTSCRDWDKDKCEEWYQESEGWQVGSNHWCCRSWTYVNKTCPLAEKSWEALNLYFSYDVCLDNVSSYWYTDSTATCGPTPSNAVGGRRLGARRRTASLRRRAGSSATSSSVPRRRTSNPRRRTAVAPRRRAPNLPRRRASYETPRRRAPPRRRAAPPPPPTPRRRTPTRVSSSDRRRAAPTPRRRAPTADLARRRAPVATETTPRRRATPPVPPRRRAPPRRRQIVSGSQPRRRAPAPPRRRSPPRRRAAPRRRETEGRRRVALNPRRRSPSLPRRRAAVPEVPRRRAAPALPPRRRTPRRRAPIGATPAPAPVATPRRRAAPRRRVAPTSVTPRRRAQTPRRRAVTSVPRRRRSTPRRRAPTLPRRRRSSPPRRRVPASARRRAPSSQRRRQDITGGTFSVSPRRREAGIHRRRRDSSTPPRRRRIPATPRRRSPPRRRAVTAPRRRAPTTDPRRRRSLPRRRVSYGYGGRQSVAENYGGSVPQTTSSGLVGNGPKQRTSLNLVMAGAAGVATTAAVGVGGYMLYNSISGRRRDPSLPPTPPSPSPIPTPTPTPTPAPISASSLATHRRRNWAGAWEKLTAPCLDTASISGNLRVSTAEECASNCDSVPDCLAFDTNGELCYLQANCEGTVGDCVGTCGYRKTTYHRRRTTHRRRATTTTPAPAHRRRQDAAAQNFLDKSWCRVPSGPYKGQLQECIDCFQSFGSSCVSETGCFQSTGCFYELNKDMARDDIMVAAFFPQHFTPPLTFTITKLDGADFNATSICPQQKPETSTFDDMFVKSSSVGVDVIVTLTQVETVTNTASIQLEIGNIQYAQLNSDSAKKAQFIEAVKVGVVQSIDADISTDDITVQISSDMVVEVIINPGGDDSAYEVGMALNSSRTSIYTNVVREIDEGVTNVATIKTSASAAITAVADDVDIPTEIAPPDSEALHRRRTQTPTPTPEAVHRRRTAPAPTPVPRTNGTVDSAQPFSQPATVLIMLIVARVFLRLTSGRH